MRTLAFFLLFCTGLLFELSARQNNFYSTNALDELRLELSDVKHELHSARVEINLLEEKLAKQEHTLSLSKNQDAQKQNEKKTYAAQLDSLEKKVERLEKILDKAAIDLRTLNAHENKAVVRLQELESVIALQEKKFEEIAKLKSTLTTISKAIGRSAQTTIAASSRPIQTYNVKPGDSLEKIARSHHMTVDAIKQLNQLSQDKILIGQELKVFDDEKK